MSNDEYQQQQFWAEKPMVYISGIRHWHTYNLTGKTEIKFEPVKDKKGWFTIKTSNK